MSTMCPNSFSYKGLNSDKDGENSDKDGERMIEDI